MKKLFLAICFSLLATVSLQAKVEEVLDIANVPQPQQNVSQGQETVHQVTAEELSEYLADRIEKAVIQDADKLSTGSIFVEPSREATESQKEQQKSAFQKIYDQAMERLTSGAGEEIRPDMQRFSFEEAGNREQQQKIWNQPDFPVINVMLPPDDRRIVVPAAEHIPYLQNDIEILPDGLVKFNETIVVVANGEKLAKGLTKILPGYVYSREGKRQKLDYTLLKVTVNGQEVPYRLKAQGLQVLIIPESDYRLEPGVYTYNFQYVNDQLLWDYGNFREFYWDVTGSSWNLVIGMAGAKITLPPGISPLEQQVFTGYSGRLNSDNAVIMQTTPATWGYLARSPLFIGEGLHLILSLPENAIMAPTLGKRLVTQFDRHGDVIISLLALAAIWSGFILSWRYIRANKGQLKVNLRKNAVLLRYLVFEKFDRISLAAFLLELYRKNIIDIQQSEETILLIKRTDNLHSLSPAERKAVGALFSGSDAILNVCKSNLLKIRRAAVFLEKELFYKLQLYMLKLNSGYLFFSLGMLIIADLFIALLQVNTLTVWVTALGCLAVMAAGVILFNIRFAKLWAKILAKIGGIAVASAAIVAMSAIISPWAAILQLTALIVIGRYTTAYANRNGLLKEQISEAENLRQHLLQHKENILLGREITAQQPNIVALNLIEEFISETPPCEYNKLKTIQAMLQKLK